MGVVFLVYRRDDRHSPQTLERIFTTKEAAMAYASDIDSRENMIAIYKVTPFKVTE